MSTAEFISIRTELPFPDGARNAGKKRKLKFPLTVPKADFSNLFNMKNMKKSILVFILVFFLKTILHSQGSFNEIAIDADSMESISASVIDFNNDELQDIFISLNNGNNVLFKNLGNLKFLQIFSPAGLTMREKSKGRGAAWADFNEDGFIDLFVGSLSAQNSALFKNNGDETFTDVTDSAGFEDLPHVFCPAWGDYNNDGHVDIFLSTGSSFKRLYRNSGSGKFTEVAIQAGIIDSTLGRSATWGDYDNDGDLDLYVVNAKEHDYSPENKLFKNNGDGTFTDISSSAGVNCGGIGNGAAWGDYDNDGDLDLFVTNNGTNRFYENLGNDRFNDIISSLGMADSMITYGVAWGDFNNDGFLDLFLVNDYMLNNLYMNSQYGTFIDKASNYGVADIGSGKSTALADINEDGKLDIFLLSYPRNHLYQNDLAEGNWLLVKATGDGSSPDAIGTRLTLYAGELTLHREISGGTGYLAQNELQVHFGFGNNTIDSLIIRWSIGTVDRLYDVQSNQKIHVREGVGIVTNVKNNKADQIPDEFVLFQNYPNPFNQQTAISYRIPAYCKVRLDVYNILGQLVITLVNETKQPGLHKINWNGKDSTGKDVPSGLYVYKIKAGNSENVRKMILMK